MERRERNEIMKQAIIYTRFSPRPDAETSQSCEKQHERCGNYCYNKNYTILNYYSDKAVSGKLFNRPELSAAIEQLKPGMVLVVDSGDRLARDMLVNLTIRHQVEQAGATIEYADGSPSTTTPEGELFTNMLAAFAQYERSRISFRTKRGLARRQANGEWFGKSPVGWMRDPKNSKKLVECEQEQRAINLAKYLTKKGWKSSSIAEILTGETGSFRGNPWSARTVRKILKNPDARPDPSFCSDN